MKIESSTIGLASQHTSSRQVIIEESLRAWVGPQRPNFEGRAAGNSAAAAQLTVAKISAAGREIAARAQTSANVSADTQAASESEEAIDQAGGDPKLQVLIGLIEALTGKKVRLFNPNELKHGGTAPSYSQQTAGAAQPAPRLGGGIRPA